MHAHTHIKRILMGGTKAIKKGKAGAEKSEKFMGAAYIYMCVRVYAFQARVAKVQRQAQQHGERPAVVQGRLLARRHGRVPAPPAPLQQPDHTAAHPDSLSSGREYYAHTQLRSCINMYILPSRQFLPDFCYYSCCSGEKRMVLL